jgi:hypothetical protein
MSTTALPITLSPNSLMTEDYLLTTNILTLGDVPVAMFANAQGCNETFVIDSATNLCHVYPDPATDSGWNIATLVPNSTATAVAATLINKVANAFYIDAAGHVFHIALTSATTASSPADTGAVAETIMISMSDDGLTAYPYGVGTDGNLFLITQNSNGAWISTTAQQSGSLKGASVQLLTGGGSAWAFYAIMNKHLAYWLTDSALTPPQQGWQFVLGDQNFNPPASMIEIVGGLAASNFLVCLDANQNLWSVWSGALSYGFAYFVQITTGLAAASASVTVQAAQPLFLQVYIVDTSDHLWVLRQTAGSPTAPWYAPFPLGNTLSRTFTPIIGTNQNAAMFGIDGTGSLWSLSQSPTTTAWTAAAIQQPALPSQPAHVSTYRATVTATDANGSPLPNLAVSVTSSDACSVWVGNVAYNLTPPAAISVTTNAVGQLSVVTPATGLSTPTLTFNCNGLSKPVSSAPAQQVQTYLSGTGTLNNLPAFSGPALLAATDAQGNSLAPGLAAENADQVATGIVETFALVPPTGAPTGHPSQAPAHAGWQMDFSHPDAPTFRYLTADELAALKIGITAGLWGDIGNFFGDIWNGIKQGAVAVGNFFVDTAQATVNFTLSILNVGTQVFAFAVHTVDDAVNVVHSIFVYIGAAVDRVVEWLRALFDWNDMLNTQAVLRHYLLNATTYLDQLIAQASAIGTDFFSSLQTQIRNDATKLSAMLGSATTLSNIGQAQSSGVKATASAQPATNPASLWSSPQHSWVYEKAEQFSSGQVGLEPASSSTLSSPFQALAGAFKEAAPQLQTALEAAGAVFKDLLTDPSQLKQVGIPLMLTELSNIAGASLTFADGIFQFLLDLIEAALTSINSFLTQHVDIPLLSTIYSDVSGGQQLDVAGLIALIVAVPLTIGYKLVNGNNAPFTAEQVSQILSTTPASTSSASLTGIADPSTQTAFQFLSAGIQGIWAIFDTCLDALPDETEEDGTFVLTKVLEAIDVFFPVLEQFMGWPSPSGVPFDIPKTPSSQAWNFGMWVCYWAPCLVDGALLFVPEDDEDAEEPTFLRYMDPFGKIAAGVIGTVTLGVAITASALGAEDQTLDAAGIAANVLGPLSSVGQFLKLDAVKGATDEVSLAIQLLNDAFTGLGCSAAMFIG